LCVHGYTFISLLKSAVADINLSILRLDTTKHLSLTVRELIHGRLGKVEAVVGVVDSEDVDGVFVECDAVTSAALLSLISIARVNEGRQSYLRAVPARNAHVAANMGEVGNRALGGPAVLGHQAVGTV
jgi:hypothetical protein